MKAFEALEKIDSENDYEDALRGSVIGVFQMVIAGKESVEHLIESAAILKSIEELKDPDKGQEKYEHDYERDGNKIKLISGLNVLLTPIHETHSNHRLCLSQNE